MSWTSDPLTASTCTVFLFFGLLFKRPMLISFVFMFVWEGGIAGIPLMINHISVRHYLESIGYHMINRGMIIIVLFPFGD